MCDCEGPCNCGRVMQEEPNYTKEHQTIVSRTTGRPIEIEFGPQPGNLVPANPFASMAQARFAHANPEKFGGENKLKEWDKSTNFKALPKKVK